MRLHFNEGQGGSGFEPHKNSTTVLTLPSAKVLSYLSYWPYMPLFSDVSSGNSFLFHLEQQ